MTTADALRRELQEADVKFQANDLDGAEELYAALSIDTCEDAAAKLQAFNNRGALRIARGEHDKAAADFQEALKLKPEEADIWYNLGAAQRNGGSVEASVPSFEKCLALRNEPMYLCLCSYAEALSALGRHDEAVVQATRANKVEPSNARGHVALGFAELKSKHYRKAVNAFGDAVRLGDETARDYLSMSHSGLADAESHEGRYESAIPSYVKALDMDPTAHTVRYNYAITLRNAKKLDAAVSELRRVVAAEPDHSDATYALAIALLQIDDVAASEPHLLRAVALAPADADRLYNLAILQQKKAAYSTAVATLKQVLAMAPAHAHAPVALQHLQQAIASGAQDGVHLETTTAGAAGPTSSSPSPARRTSLTSAPPPVVTERYSFATKAAAPPPPSPSSMQRRLSVDFDPNRTYTYYSYDTLRAPPYPDDVDVALREFHLTDPDFEGLFDCSKVEYNAKPKWKRDKRKKELGLF